MSSTYVIVRDAIFNKVQVIADYDGYHREMCPHVIGTKSGREQALFYQFAGESRSGLGPPGASANWLCISIDGLTNVFIRKGPWHTVPTHSTPQTCVDDIDIEVSF